MAFPVEENNFEVYTVGSKEKVKNLILDEIFPKLHFESVSWGDSMSMLSTEIIQEVENLPNVRLLKTFEEGVPRDKIIVNEDLGL